MDNDEKWLRLLTGESSGVQERLVGSFTAVFHRIPSPPRCKLCQAPFSGPGGVFMRAIGKGRWPANPTICRLCLGGLDKAAGGAEVELSLLFADIRGSTAIAETMSAAEYRAILDHFYAAASVAVDGYGGIIDKLLGDGVMAMFLPGFATEGRHAGGAIGAARDLVVATQAIKVGSGSSLPVGVGVHTGIAFVGSIEVTPGTFDFTALGDAVNTASRLGSDAAAGEVLVSSDSVEAADFDTAGLEARELPLRGKSQTMTAWVVT